MVLRERSITEGFVTWLSAGAGDDSPEKKWNGGIFNMAFRRSGRWLSGKEV
jgi:hypothetical protein